MEYSGFTGRPIQFVLARSKLAYNDLMKYTATYFSKDWKLKPTLLNASKIIKREFLRAFSDDEGSVFRQGNKGRIHIFSINLIGLKQIQSLLLGFGIQSTIIPGCGCKRNVYAIVIRDLKTFQRKIGFNLKRKQDELSSICSKL